MSSKKRAESRQQSDYFACGRDLIPKIQPYQHNQKKSNDYVPEKHDFRSDISFGFVSDVEESLKAGISPNTRDHFGRTPLFDAVDAHQVEIVQLLIRYGAKVNARDKTGKTCLHNAAQMGDKAICRILLDSGAQPSICDYSGCRAVDVAILEIKSMLIGTNPEAKEKEIRIQTLNEIKEVLATQGTLAELYVQNIQDSSMMMRANELQSFSVKAARREFVVKNSAKLLINHWGGRNSKEPSTHKSK